MATERMTDQNQVTQHPDTRTIASIRKSLIIFFILAYAISWSIEIALILSLRGLIALQLPLSVHYLASFGPFLAALIVSLAAEGTQGVRRLFSGLGKWRVQREYLLFTVGAPLVVFTGAVLLSRLLQDSWPDLSLLGEVDYLPYLGVLPALGLWMLTYGFGEEMGWRGFALPRLQLTQSAFSASLLLGILWGFWHIPAYFYRDIYISMGVLVFFQLLSVIAASVIMTWLYNGTRGSTLMVIIFHGLFDFLSVSQAGGEFAAVFMSALMVFWAVRVYQVYGRESLAPTQKISYPNG